MCERDEQERVGLPMRGMVTCLKYLEHSRSASPILVAGGMIQTHLGLLAQASTFPRNVPIKHSRFFNGSYRELVCVETLSALSSCV